MTVNYEYNEALAVKADNAASRITEGGAYVGRFVKAFALTAESGAQGISFSFDSPGSGTVDFTLYTIGKDGQEIRGMNYANAMMFMLGVKKLESVAGAAEVWDAAEGKRVAQEVEEFPSLCGKSIGLMFQRELSTYNGRNRDNLNLEAVFQPETKLLLSEIKERKTTPVKYERMLKMCLKTKDTRKPETAEPAQPSIGASAGDY
jgi:hypothetical protein